MGLDRHAPTQRLRGDAGLTYDFTSESVDVALTNIQNLNGRGYADLTWSDVSVQHGHFVGGRGSNLLRGNFYGPNHEEVGGTFERNQIVGAFGAYRQ